MMKACAEKTKSNDKISIRLSELMYLCFFGLMLLAKGIGLYDGQAAYKLVLLTAFFCLGIKMCLTEHSYAEWAILLSLLAFSAVVYRHSGEKGVLICMITVLAMKNVSLKRVFQVGLAIWTLSVSARFLLSLIRLEEVEKAVQTKNLTGAVLRYFMGFPHPNVLHISYFIFTAFLVYCLYDKYNLKHLCMLMAGNLFFFLYSYSFTGAVIVSVFLCLAYFVCKTRINKAEYALAELVFPACLFVSIALPVLAEGRVFQLADKIFNNRIGFSKHFLIPENMSLIGNNLAAITTDIITLDNSFAFALVIYGVIIFGLICLAYLWLAHACVKEKKNIELAMICCFLAAGITEPFLFNTSFKNLTLFFLGERLFTLFDERFAGQRRFTLLKERDRDIVMDVSGIKTAEERLKRSRRRHQKGIFLAGILVSAGIAALSAAVYQAPAYVLEVQQNNLILFEKIRTAATAFVLSYLLVNLTACLVLVLWDYRREKKEPKTTV